MSSLLPDGLPPDRSHLLTEARNPRSTNLHSLSVGECVRLINEEDAAVLRAVEAAQPATIAFIEAAEPGFCAGGRLIYIGAGTSGRLGVLDASECPPTFQVEPGRVVGLIAGGDAALRRSSEGMEDDPAGAIPELHALQLTAWDAVLGIAAGGTTPYVLGALAFAGRSSSAVIGLLSCAPVPGPPGCQHLIVAPTGPEVLTGSTRMKAGTATKLILNTISTTLMIRDGKVFGNLLVDMRATNGKLHDRALRIIQAVTALDRSKADILLKNAGGHLKTAILMAHLGVSAKAAADLLHEAGGHLDRVPGANRLGGQIFGHSGPTRKPGN